MPKHMTIINLACTITKLRKWGEAWKHSAESAQATTARMQQANKELEREKFMTAGLIDKLIADRDAAWKERDTQAADHEAKMVEHRAAFGVRTEADAKIIAGLRAERDGLLTQVQDMRAEMRAERDRLTEATHDTEAGKAAAEAAVKTEPVADEIKAGDVVEVFQSTASCTFKTDIGTRGTVLQLDDSCVDTAPLDGFLAPKCNHVALCDVRKVTT